MSKVKTKGTADKIKHQNDGYLFIFPIVFMLTALIIYPATYGFCISFFNTSLMTRWRLVGFKYYTEAFTDPSFYKSALLMFELMIFVVIKHLVLGFILATLLNKEFRGRTVLRVIFMLLWFFPKAVVALLLTWIMNPICGVLNDMLKSPGIISADTSWLGSKELAFPSVAFTCIWKGLPLVMTMILAKLWSISRDLYEAAVTNEANKWNSFRCITLPSPKPILTTVIILDSVWWSRQYTQVFTMTMDGPGTITSPISLSIYRAAFNGLRFDEETAWGTLVFIICYLINSVYKVVLKGE